MISRFRRYLIGRMYGQVGLSAYDGWCRHFMLRGETQWASRQLAARAMTRVVLGLDHP
jgi:hypothetical protein